VIGHSDTPANIIISFSQENTENLQASGPGLEHMTCCYRQILPSCLIVTALFQNGLSKPESKFDICKVRLDRIRNGTETYRGIDIETVHQYLYHSPIRGMKDHYARTSRDKFIAITTEGCRAICDDPVDWYWDSDPTTTTLGIISNWILPIIALLAALPYDPGQGGSRLKNAGRTILELGNWLGSPQTALTATFSTFTRCENPSGQSDLPTALRSNLSRRMHTTCSAASASSNFQKT